MAVAVPPDAGASLRAGARLEAPLLPDALKVRKLRRFAVLSAGNPLCAVSTEKQPYCPLREYCRSDVKPLKEINMAAPMAISSFKDRPREAFWRMVKSVHSRLFLERRKLTN